MEGRSKRIREKVLRRTTLEDGTELTDVTRVIHHADCWLWGGPTSGEGRGGGYGRVCIDGATMAVHRVMFILFHGPIPPRKQIDHTCRNRLCCNPEHLELVTARENARRRDNPKERRDG